MESVYVCGGSNWAAVEKELMEFEGFGYGHSVEFWWGGRREGER